MRKLSMDELNRPDLDTYKAENKFPVILALDDIRSMHNVGSVFRTCDALNVERVILGGITPKPPHREIHKTALGATESVPWEYAPELAIHLKQLQQKGTRILAVEQTDQSIPLQKLGMAGEPVCFVFGNEAFGVSDDVLAMVDGAVEIPQFGIKHSFNISVAVGIILWDFIRKNKLID